MLISTYSDLTALDYMETDCRDIVYLFTRTIGPKIYAITDSEGTVDFLNTSKDDLTKQFEFIEFNDMIRLIYKDHYFVCLSYTDDKLDGFGVMYNIDGKRSVRDVDLFFREYADQWIIKKGSVVN